MIDLKEFRMLEKAIQIAATAEIYPLALSSV